MSNTKPYPTLTLLNLLSGPTEIDWLIEPFIPPGASVLLAGNSGVGKTWLSLDLALSVVTGTKWLGHFSVRQGRVLIVDEENSELLLRIRLLKLLRGRGIDVDDFPIRFLVGKAVNLSPTRHRSGTLTTTKGYNRLLATVKILRPVLVIFDSLTRCHRANENSSSEMAAVFANVKRLQNETNCSTLLVHHFRKSGSGGSRSGNRIRGSSDIRAFVDATLLVDEREGGCVITHDKSRWAEPVKSFEVDFHDSDDSFVIAYTGEESRPAPASQRAWDIVRRALEEDGVLSRRELLDRLDGTCSARTMDSVLKWRTDNEFLDKHRDGKRVIYTLIGERGETILVQDSSEVFVLPVRA